MATVAANPKNTAANFTATISASLTPSLWT